MPSDPSDGVAYLLISLTDTFEYSGEGDGSKMIVVPLGVLNGGGSSVTDTTFTPEDAIFVPVTSLPNGVTFADLDGNATTIMGTVLTSEEQPHMINGSGTAVNNDVEEAIYLATHDAGFTALFRNDHGTPLNPNDDTPLYPTTDQIVNFIATFLPEGSDVTDQQIATATFGTDTSLSLPGDTSPTVEAAGELFPHSDHCECCGSDCGCECSCECSGDDCEAPPPEPIFQFSFLVSKTGPLDLALCDQIIDIQIDILESSINLKKKGVLPVAILTTDDFDAQDVDPGTVTLGGVPAVKYAVEDVDGDGDDDVVLHFSVPDLVDGGFLNKDTLSLSLKGQIYEDIAEGADICVRGSDTVKITPNNKK